MQECHYYVDNKELEIKHCDHLISDLVQLLENKLVFIEDLNEHNIKELKRFLNSNS